MVKFKEEIIKIIFKDKYFIQGTELNLFFWTLLFIFIGFLAYFIIPLILNPLEEYLISKI